MNERLIFCDIADHVSQAHPCGFSLRQFDDIPNVMRCVTACGANEETLPYARGKDHIPSPSMLKWISMGMLKKAASGILLARDQSSVNRHGHKDLDQDGNTFSRDGSLVTGYETGLSFEKPLDWTDPPPSRGHAFLTIPAGS